MLRLHSALVVSRILYALPYMKLSRSDSELLERIHRRGLRTSLGVPSSTRNDLVYIEAQALPLPLLATQRLLLQKLRLHETATGRSLLQRLAKRTSSRFHISLQTLKHLGWQSEARPDSFDYQPKPPWEAYIPKCNEKIPGIPNKKISNEVVLKMTATEYIETTFKDFLQVYTDGSVNRHKRSSTAAYNVPAYNLQWSGRIDQMVSSTTAEIIAIVEALHTLKRFTPQKVVVLTDSRCALQQLKHIQGTSEIAVAARSATESLEDSGFKICFQWIPAHVGLAGNERADNLATNAHNKERTIHTPDDPKAFRIRVKEHLGSLSEAKNSQHQPCLSGSLRRKEATLLYRLRTGTARTRQLLHKWGKVPSASCDSCGVTEDLNHLLCDCNKFESHRKDFAQELNRHNFKINDITDLIYPTGRRARRKLLQTLFLNFLQATGLQARL